MHHFQKLSSGTDIVLYGCATNRRNKEREGKGKTEISRAAKTLDTIQRVIGRTFGSEVVRIFISRFKNWFANIITYSAAGRKWETSVK